MLTSAEVELDELLPWSKEIVSQYENQISY